MEAIPCESTPNDRGALTKVRECDANGQTATTSGLPSCLGMSSLVRAMEHLCAPSFRQHAGRSFCARSTASAGRRGPTPKSIANISAMARRKVSLGYRMGPAEARETDVPRANSAVRLADVVMYFQVLQLAPGMPGFLAPND